MGKTSFQDSWLKKTDINGTTVSAWAEKDLENDEYHAHCKICGARILCEKGFKKLNQHAKTDKHKKNLVKINTGQLNLVVSINNSIPSAQDVEPTAKSNAEQRNIIHISKSTSSSAQIHSPQSSLSLFNKQDATTRAEIYYLLEVISSNSSLNACDGKKELFQVMFPGETSNAFTLSRTKGSYLLIHALYPYFKEILLKELQQPNVYFTLQFDETGNVKSKKELQIRIQYWSNSQNSIVNRYLVTYFIEKGDAITLVKYLFQSLNSHGLSSKHLLTLGKDGPNVNKKVFRLLQEEQKKLKFKGLYDVGSCLLHVANNGFVKGNQELPIEISDVLVKMYHFFHQQHLRCENFHMIQKEVKVPEHSFIQHSDTRWLTMSPSAERVYEQLPALIEYFSKYLPAKEKSTIQKQSYLDIRKYLLDKLLKPFLLFIAYVSKIFTVEFTAKMQKAEPLIHILYSQLKRLIYLLCSNIVKPDVLSSEFLELSAEELLSKSNLVNVEKITLGMKVKEAVAELTKLDQLLFLKGIQKFYLTTVTYLLDKITNVKTLKYFACLAPENIKLASSLDDIVQIANLLPLTDIDIDCLSHEWRLLQLDSDVAFVLAENQRIDEYWAIIFSLRNQPNQRYSNVTRVVKAALSLTHGSADVERGFSESGRVLTDDRANMDLQTLNARLTVRDGLKMFDYKPHRISITPELLKLARTAHRSHQAYLEEKKKISDEQKKKKEKEVERKKREEELLKNVNDQKETLEKLETQLIEEKKQYKIASNDAEKMQSALRDAAKNSSSPAVLQQLISGLENLRNVEKNQRSAVEKTRTQIEKKKSRLIDNVVSKKIKTK